MAFPLILSIVTALPASFEKQIPELATITSKMATPMKTEAAGQCHYSTSTRGL
jgi:hypothetical protein